MTARPMSAVQIELANPATRLRPIPMDVWRCACGLTPLAPRTLIPAYSDPRSERYHPPLDSRPTELRSETGGLCPGSPACASCRSVCRWTHFPIAASPRHHGSPSPCPTPPPSVPPGGDASAETALHPA